MCRFEHFHGKERHEQPNVLNDTDKLGGVVKDGK